MERRIDELEGRLTAINDKLSGVVNQFNDDKQKFKDETELEFAQHKLVFHKVVEGARKEFEGLPAWTKESNTNAIFVANAWICACRATDCDLESVFVRRRVNAWICARRATDRDPALDRNLQCL